MSVMKRYMEFLKEKGKLPKSYSKEPDMLAYGGITHGSEMDEEDEWMDDGWNDHDDQRMGVSQFACGGMVKKKYAKGGMVGHGDLAMALMKRGKK